MEVFDIETNGFLKDMTKIHCISTINTETNEVKVFNDQGNGLPSIEEGVRYLQDKDLGGHNILEFDIKAIKKIYSWFTPTGVTRDSYVISQLIWPDIKQKDFKYLNSHPDFPKKLIGRHSLESWGARLGCPKDDYSVRCKEKGIDPWAEWNQDMEDYCVQDTKTNLRFFKLINKKKYSELAIDLEQRFSQIMRRQEAYGFMFNTEKAAKLYALLVDRKQQLEKILKKAFGFFYIRNGKNTTPKKTMKKWVACEHGVSLRKEEKGYYAYHTEKAEYCKIKLIEFNPGSRDQIANRLIYMRKWKPKVFTPEGKPQVDEVVLKSLKAPERDDLIEYFLIAKRIGQVAEGKESWLHHEKDGRIHGRVNSLGAVTRRCSHSKPNVAQVPAVYSEYGKECRELFCVPKGKKLLGFDADGLELRCLAGYMAKWDAGDYVKVVTKGTKEEGTDIHTRNMIILGIKSRDDAKTWMYAYLYGAGDIKLGTIIAISLGLKRCTKGKLSQLGKEARSKFESGLPALGKLVKGVKKAARLRGSVKGLDGGRLNVRSEHSALNTLLQGCGAIIMKMFAVILDEAAQARGWIPGKDYEFVANIHDEVQVELEERIANEFGRLCEESLIKAGEFFEFKCPITGSYAIGDNWAETH